MNTSRVHPSPGVYSSPPLGGIYLSALPFRWRLCLFLFFDLLKQRPAPGARIDIRDCLRESPAMTGRIFDRILPFAIGKVCGWADDLGAGLFGAFVVAVYIWHAHHDRVAELAGRRRRQV